MQHSLSFLLQRFIWGGGLMERLIPFEGACKDKWTRSLSARAGAAWVAKHAKGLH